MVERKKNKYVEISDGMMVDQEHMGFYFLNKKG